MSDTKKYLVGIFNDDDILLHAVKGIRKDGYEISNAYTPFPVHGLEHALGLEETRLHTFINKFNYPTNVGGKPYWGLLAYVPITFEQTVLAAAVGMTVSFYYLCKLYPGKKPKIVDERTTDNMFALTFELDAAKDNSYVNAVTELLKKEGAIEVYQKEV